MLHKQGAHGLPGKDYAVDESLVALEKVVPLQGMLGYLNLSAGKPDPRFQKQLSDAYAFLAGRSEREPHKDVQRVLGTRLAELHASGSSAFRDVRQAETVLALTFDKVLPAYRAHHADLLFHQSDRDLFQPFFLARVFEAVLAHDPLQDNADQLTTAVLRRLNDYVGHRPVAILETRPRGEPYEHERVRPIPLYLRGAGVAYGRYRDLIARALEILGGTNPALLAEAYFDPALLDELALDPRAYDHAHPLNRRPNQVFGEWDPHHIDNQGRYRRFVVRQIMLDALLERVEQGGHLAKDEVMSEAAAVLGGTLLMATGISGAGPETHDSSTSLATLLPRIARYREAYYGELLRRISGPHGERLRAEAQASRQPFGGARQHLNQYLARHRALQLQLRHLALLLAEIGYPDASRRQAAHLPAASVRLVTEMHIRLTAGRLHAERGEVRAGAEQLPVIEDLLHRGIACGALADPWNILGFQGLFPLFTAMEDSVRDPRIDELVHGVEQLLNLHARLMSEAAAAGESALVEKLSAAMRRLAAWWDPFATVEVGDVRRVHGGEAAASAEHVATALAHWRERGEATADLAFWRDHLDGFRSPKAFALVVDALLNKQDFRAAMALLVSWVGQVEQVPLEDGEHSFHSLALRWMLGVSALARDQAAAVQPAPSIRAFELAAKLLDYLEANAEDYWNVPRLDMAGLDVEEAEEVDEQDELFGAAYEGVTYQDTTDDDVEGEVLETGPQQDFDLEAEGERLEKRLRFLSTVARLWNLATRIVTVGTETSQGAPGAAERSSAWLARARKNYQDLLGLLDMVHDHPVPEPSGSHESMVEYDRRRALKERLLHVTLATCLDTAMAIGALQGTQVSASEASLRAAGQGKRPAWEPLMIRLEQTLWHRDIKAARQILPDFLREFKDEPLLFTPLAHGGHPRQVLRASIAQTILRTLAANLPRLGLLRETYQVVLAAHGMEQAQPLQGPRVTEFNRLFQIACQAVVHAVVDASEAAPTPPADEPFVDFLEAVVEPFLALWMDHSKTLRVSVLEALEAEADWSQLQDFIQRYGAGLFHARFMTLGNLRGILHGGVNGFLDYLRANPDPLHPVNLVDDLDRVIGRAEAERALQIILQAVIENYEEYRDYNTTTPQSDYGENLHTLLAFLRLKASYERHAWQLRPLLLVHEILARRRSPAAARWQEQVADLTEEIAEQHLEELARLEKAHGMHLRTIADRLRERFVKPLAIDRLCALIEPAIDEAHHPERGQDAFAQLESGLVAYRDTPTGVGLEVPEWLRRLQGEVQRVRMARTAVATLAESQFQIPKVVVPLEELSRQMLDWEKLRATE
jgi:hypothetical protein